MKPSPNPISRRRFLQRSALAGGSLPFFPLLLPAGVLAADGNPGANDRIGIGFIGMGRQAGDLLKMLVGQPQARVTAVADVNYPRALAVALPHRAEAFQDYRRLLEWKSVDAIITATPEHWRVLICLHACQAGKDLYVEKPMSLTIREGRLMAEAVRKYGRVWQTGSQQRSMWPNHAACAFIRAGGLGRIRRVIAHNYPTPWTGMLPAQPLPSGLDWDAWCGPTEPTPYHEDLYLPRANPGWLSFRPYSGGEMTGWGAHGFDQVQWALGMDASGPVEVRADGEPLQPPRYTAPESRERGDAACSQSKVTFLYPNDIVMELGAGPPGGAIFIGDKGRATVDRGFLKTDPPELAEQVLAQDKGGFKPNHLANWLECIRTRKTTAAPVEVGHRTATVCHLGNIARWLGRRLTWDPVREVFPDDEEANTFLDRRRRRGYEIPQVL